MFEDNQELPVKDHQIQQPSDWKMLLPQKKITFFENIWNSIEFQNYLNVEYYYF